MAGAGAGAGAEIMIKVIKIKNKKIFRLHIKITYTIIEDGTRQIRKLLEYCNTVTGCD